MRFNENFNSISFSILTSLKNLKTGHFFIWPVKYLFTHETKRSKNRKTGAKDRE